MNDAGRLVYDSPVNNATAHYLHNMLFLGGAEMESSARPSFLEAECYRGNEIENFDTACCRITTDEVPEILFFTSHCVERNDGPVFELKFERGSIRYSTEVPSRLSSTRADTSTMAIPRRIPWVSFGSAWIDAHIGSRRLPCVVRRRLSRRRSVSMASSACRCIVSLERLGSSTASLC